MFDKIFEEYINGIKSCGRNSYKFTEIPAIRWCVIFIFLVSGSCIYVSRDWQTCNGCFGICVFPFMYFLRDTLSGSEHENLLKKIKIPYLTKRIELLEAILTKYGFFNADKDSWDLLLEENNRRRIKYSYYQNYKLEIMVLVSICSFWLGKLWDIVCSNIPADYAIKLAVALFIISLGAWIIGYNFYWLMHYWLNPMYYKYGDFEYDLRQLRIKYSLTQHQDG